jgi:hypothetical protein
VLSSQVASAPVKVICVLCPLRTRISRAICKSVSTAIDDDESDIDPAKVKASLLFKTKSHAFRRVLDVDAGAFAFIKSGVDKVSTRLSSTQADSRSSRGKMQKTPSRELSCGKSKSSFYNVTLLHSYLLYVVYEQVVNARC